MLKKRIIACLLLKDGIVVQSIGFRRYLPVGRPEIAVEFLNQWGIDEIVLLDIDAFRQGRKIDLDIVRRVSKYCQVPLTVGGGLRTLDDLTDAIHSGADKISLNSIVHTYPELVREGAGKFGSQCIIVSIDALRNGQNYEVMTDSGRRATGMNPVELAQKVEALGAGELFLNSIDRDGSQNGYDMNICEKTAAAVDIPVIICGGVGHVAHLAEGLACENISGVAAANFFHFTEHSVNTVKAWLYAHGHKDLRLDTYADYQGSAFDSDYRIAKKSDEELEQLLYEYHPKEVI